MSFADSLLHPRESTLVKGWGMEVSNVSNEQALYVKQTDSAPMSAASTPSAMGSAWSFISRTTTNTSLAPSVSSAGSKPARPEALVNDIDSGYGSSPETTSTTSPKKSKRSAKRSKSRDHAAIRRSTTPIPGPKSSTSSSAMTQESPPRGRSFGFKLSFRSRSKSRDSSPSSRKGKSSANPSEQVPPVPKLNLPLAQKFSRSNTPVLPSPMPFMMTDLSKDIWNDTPLLPSTRRASKRASQAYQLQLAAARQPLSNKSNLLSPPNGKVQFTDDAFLNPSPSNRTIRRRRSSADITFSVGSPPITPADMIQPKSFLSMSTSTVDLTQLKKKQKKKVPAGNFLTSFGKSAGGAANRTPNASDTSQTKGFKKSSSPLASGSGSKATSSQTSKTPKAANQPSRPAHFSFVEISEDERIHIPMSWIEVDAPLEALAPEVSSLPSRKAIPPKWKAPPNIVVKHVDEFMTHSNSSSLSEYDPFAAAPPAAVYAQSLPAIQRGRQAPFPSQPLLPPSLIPRIRAAHYQDVARYKNLVLAERSARAITRREAKKTPLLTPSQASEYSEDARNRNTVASGVESAFDRTSIMTEGKSSELRREFENAVGKMIHEETAPVPLVK